MQKNILPNENSIRQHLEFLFKNMPDYDDGKIEISILNQSEHFAHNQINAATQKALEWNNQGKSVYVIAATIDPDSAPFGRASDSDFYASSVIWCDIDDPIEPEQLKKLYADCPPNLAVITARTPHRRTQLWWKLDEPLADQETLREALRGVANILHGDRAVTNPVRLMRLAGTVNYPTEKKRNSGRINEVTDFHMIHANTVNIDKFIQVYKEDGYVHNCIYNPEVITSVEKNNPFVEKISDGRDKYMSDMVYASVLNLTKELKRWPTPQEVYDDCWPVYYTKVAAREGRTLDEDGRGSKLMQSKINSKLSAFQRGKMRGFETVEAIKRVKTTLSIITDHLQDNAQDGEIKEDYPTNLLPFTWAYDIKPRIDANDFVEGFLGTEQFSVVYGESNCGKTFFMTDLAFHVALGKEWRGLRVDQGGVVYVALEGGFGLSNRIAAFMQEHAKEAAGMPLAVITTQIDFLDPEGKLGAFIDTVAHVAEKVGNVKLVVIDTLARAISGGDENSGQDMGRLVAHADLIRKHTGAHVCFIHHSGKDKAKGARGHSSLRAAVDTEIEVSRLEEEKHSTVKIVKQRDMEIGGEMHFGLKQICIGINKYNEEVKSCTVTVIDKDEISSLKTPKEPTLTPAQRFAYEAICNSIADRGVSISVRDVGPVNAISYDDFNSKLAEMGWAKYDDEFKTKKATNNIRAKLREKNKICFDSGYIWLPRID